MTENVAPKNVLVEKSFQLALLSIKVYQTLLDKKLYDIARQILRCGTSIGANLNEAQAAQSTKDFIHKLSISYKEAKELDYWIKLIVHSKILNKEEIRSIYMLNVEINKMLASAITTTKNKLKTETNK